MLEGVKTDGVIGIGIGMLEGVKTDGVIGAHPGRYSHETQACGPFCQGDAYCFVTFSRGHYTPILQACLTLRVLLRGHQVTTPLYRSPWRHMYGFTWRGIPECEACPPNSRIVAAAQSPSLVNRWGTVTHGGRDPSPPRRLVICATWRHRD